MSENASVYAIAMIAKATATRHAFRSANVNASASVIRIGIDANESGNGNGIALLETAIVIVIVIVIETETVKMNANANAKGRGRGRGTKRYAIGSGHESGSVQAAIGDVIEKIGGERAGARKQVGMARPCAMLGMRRVQAASTRRLLLVEIAKHSSSMIANRQQLQPVRLGLRRALARPRTKCASALRRKLKENAHWLIGSAARRLRPRAAHLRFALPESRRIHACRETLLIRPNASRLTALRSTPMHVHTRLPRSLMHRSRTGGSSHPLATRSAPQLVVMAAAITGEIAQPAEPATHEAFLKVPRNSPAPNHSLFNTLVSHLTPIRDVSTIDDMVWKRGET